MAFIGSVHTKYLDLINNSKYKKGILLINQRLPRNEIMGIISEADVLLIIEAASNESPFMPGKIADYIGLNKTILALSPEGSETRRILGKDYPYQCEPDDENSIHLIIDALYTKWSQGNSLNLNKPLLQDYVSSGHVIKEIEKIFLLK